MAKKEKAEDAIPKGHTRAEWRGLKQAQVCGALKISPQTLNNWRDLGCPAIPGDKTCKYDLRDILDWRVAYEIKKAAGNEGVAAEFSEQLERYRKIKADAAEFDLDAKKKKYLPVDEVRSMVRKMADLVRADLQGIAHRISVKLSRSEDPEVCEEMVEVEINKALMNMASVQDEDD